MEAILEDYISTEDLKRFESVYQSHLQNGTVTPLEQFDYAWCLIRSKYPTDIRRGVVLLEDLFQHGTNATEKRDYMYYLAIGHTKLKDYNRALDLLSRFLGVEPANTQAQELQKHIKEKLHREGMLGMAIVGGAALAIGSLVGIGICMSRTRQ